MLECRNHLFISYGTVQAPWCFCVSYLSL